MNFNVDGRCFVLNQGNWIHPHAPQMRDLCLWYPERGMPFFEQVNYRPYVKSIVTESPWLIGLYDREQVFAVDEDGAWRNPNMQTYGASLDWITHQLLHWQCSISAQPLDGGKCLAKEIAEYKQRIDKATKLYSKKS